MVESAIPTRYSNRLITDKGFTDKRCMHVIKCYCLQFYLINISLTVFPSLFLRCLSAVLSYC